MPHIFRFVQFLFGFKIPYTPFSSEFTKTATTFWLVKVLNIASVIPHFFRFVQFLFGFKIRYTPFSSEFNRTAQTIRFVKILSY